MTGERAAVAAFAVSGLFAGGNAVGVRFSNRELDPLWGACVRFSLAALVLLATMAVMRLAFPRERALRGALLYGGLNFGASYALFYFGLVEIHAGLGQTVLALVPLATLVLAVAWGEEQLRGAAVVGALLALAGISVMSGVWTSDEPVPLLSLLALVGSAVCFAQSAVFVRRFPTLHPVTLNAVGMATGGLLLAAASALAGQAIDVPEREETWAAIAYLVLLGSVTVFILYVFVLKHWTASRTSYGFVITPVITLALSAWLDDEPIGLSLLAGGLLVIAGVYIGALRRRRDAPAAIAPG